MEIKKISKTYELQDQKPKQNDRVMFLLALLFAVVMGLFLGVNIYMVLQWIQA